MTTPSTPADTIPAASVPVSSAVPSAPAPPSWPWRRAALIPVSRLAGVIGVLVLVAGIAGGILHTGLFFVPALAALAVGTVKLWREHP